MRIRLNYLEPPDGSLFRQTTRRVVRDHTGDGCSVILVTASIEGRFSGSSMSFVLTSMVIFRQAYSFDTAAGFNPVDECAAEFVVGHGERGMWSVCGMQMGSDIEFAVRIFC